MFDVNRKRTISLDELQEEVSIEMKKCGMVGVGAISSKKNEKREKEIENIISSSKARIKKALGLCDEVIKGGRGSGNFGHAGRAGQVGGSGAKGKAGGGSVARESQGNYSNKPLDKGKYLLRLLDKTKVPFNVARQYAVDNGYKDTTTTASMDFMSQSLRSGKIKRDYLETRSNYKPTFDLSNGSESIYGSKKKDKKSKVTIEYYKSKPKSLMEKLQDLVDKDPNAVAIRNIGNYSRSDGL